MVDYSETVDVYDIKVSTCINNEYMKIHVGHLLTKGPYDQNWKFESDTCFKTSIHVEPSLKISMIYRQRQRNYMLLNWYRVPSLRTSFLNIKTLFNVTPFYLYDVEHDGAVQHHNSNIWVGIPFLLCVWMIIPLKWTNFVAMEPCFYGSSSIIWIWGASVIRFLWQQSHDFSLK